MTVPSKYLSPPFAQIYAGVMSVPECFKSVKTACKAVLSTLSKGAPSQKILQVSDDAEVAILLPDGINQEYQLQVNYLYRGDNKAILHTQVPTLAAIIESLEAVIDPYGKGKV